MTTPARDGVREYEVRKGKNGEWGIFSAAFNVRIASFHQNTEQDREKIAELLASLPQPPSTQQGQGGINCHCDQVQGVHHHLSTGIAVPVPSIPDFWAAVDDSDPKMLRVTYALGTGYGADASRTMVNDHINDRPYGVDGHPLRVVGLYTAPAPPEPAPVGEWTMEDAEKLWKTLELFGYAPDSISDHNLRDALNATFPKGRPAAVRERKVEDFDKMPDYTRRISMFFVQGGFGQLAKDWLKCWGDLVDFHLPAATPASSAPGVDELLREAADELEYQDTCRLRSDPMGLRETPPRVARLISKLRAALRPSARGEG